MTDIPPLPKGAVPITPPLPKGAVPMGQTSPSEPDTPGFPYDKPGTTYGDILPFARDEQGNTSLAVPEAIRAPLRGAIQWGGNLMGKGATPGSPESRQPTADQLSAVMALGGAKAAPGSAVSTEIAPRAIPRHVTNARSVGYVLPPAMTGKPGAITSALSGWGGKIKLQQGASVKNQEITNQLSAQTLGLPKDTVLNDQVLNDVRTKAGKAYEDVEKAVPFITPDDQFRLATQALGSRASHAAQYFPQLMNNPGINAVSQELSGVQYFSPRAGLEVVKELRFNGNANLKAPGDPMKHALGLAQRQAADAIDSLMDREIEKAAYSGKDTGARISPDLVSKYRKARQQIAKSYDIEGAMNPATGDVNALGIGKLAVKGRPLTGELDQIANAANAFPRALQNVARFGGEEQHSAVDFFGSSLAIGHGNPALAATIAGRPAARKLLLSSPYQNRLANPRPSERTLPTQGQILPLLTPGEIAGGQQ